MSVILELTELEADFVAQALSHELSTTELILRHPDAFEPEVLDNVAIKVALLDGIIQRLAAA